MCVFPSPCHAHFFPTQPPKALVRLWRGPFFTCQVQEKFKLILREVQEIHIYNKET